MLPHKALVPLIAAVVVMCLIRPLVASPPHSPPGLPPQAMPQQLIVRLAPDGDIADILAAHDTFELRSMPEHNLVLLKLPPQINENALLQLLAVNQNVQWVDFNISLGLSDGSTQSFFLSASHDDFITQGTFDLLELEEANQHATGEGVIVAVLDTGVDSTHELLAGRVLDYGYDFINMSQGAHESDEAVPGQETFVGHGTYVAGLIASVAPEASILPIKVLDESGAGDLFQVAAGILYALDHGAKVLNLSLGSTIEAQMLNYAMEQAEAAGAIVIAAAGNLNQVEPAEYPAAHPLVLAIASTELNDTKTTFSNYGAHIDLSVPGNGIVSSFPGNSYAVVSGTSASTAIAAGAAALLYSAMPNVEPSDVRQLLKDAAVDIDDANPGYEGLLGSGRLRIVESLITVDTLPGDINSDGTVDIHDLMLLLADWGDCVDPDYCPADLSEDGTVGSPDLFILLSNWG